MTWEDIINDSSLEDLPYKVELNEWGQIVLSPISDQHRKIQIKILSFLTDTLSDKGEVMIECAVAMSNRVLVPDIAWASDDFIEKHGDENPYSKAPEICVEVISPSDHLDELRERRQLYFDSGANEVWEITEKEELSYFNKNGLVSNSIYNINLNFTL